MKFWLMKSEPETYSIQDLERDKKTLWEGVRNYQARNFMKDMKKGDQILFYHSNAKDKGVVGVGTITEEAHPDPFARNKKSKYYDPRAEENPSLWVVVEVSWKKTFPNVVTLERMKKEKKLQNMKLVQRGNRLSVFPVEKDEFEHVLSLSKV